MKLSGPTLFLAAALSESVNAQLSTTTRGVQGLRGLEAAAMSMPMMIVDSEQGGAANYPVVKEPSVGGKSGKEKSGKAGKTSKPDPSAVCNVYTRPSVEVPHCDHGKHTATINKRLVTLAADFPEATVDICYSDTALEFTLTAMEETSFLVNDTFVNNDPIWMWTVMEAFIGTGENDSTEYFQFDVSPLNVVWAGYIHNPYKNFTSSATAFVDDWESYPITYDTTKDVGTNMWKSDVTLPLTMFNVEEPKGTKWRMNFSRTYYAGTESAAGNQTTSQEYGMWYPNTSPTFHQTPCFGEVKFA